MPGLSPYNRTLTANQFVNINVRGTTVFLRQATGPIRVRMRSTATGDKSGESYELTMEPAEQWLAATEFDSLEVTDASGEANTIELYIGYGLFTKPVPDIVNVQVSSPASATAESSADETNIDVGAAGIVQLLAADSTRINAWITALSGNTDNIRVGDANVDTDQGTQLEPGETILWSSKAACYACSEATANQGAAIMEFKL